MKNIIYLLKRVIMSLCILYAYNIITSKIGFFIPINIYTILFISLLDLPGLLTLIILKLLI